MPKRRYINAKALLERIYGQQRRITTRQAELLDEWLRLEEAKVLLEDRAEDHFLILLKELTCTTTQISPRCDPAHSRVHHLREYLMSRTDKTKPFWVKLMHHDLDWEELHHHEDGGCDLPAIDDKDAFVRNTTKCFRSFIYTGTNTCCCGLCHWAWDLRPGKRQRLDGKAACQNWMKEYE